ncbi:30S ribosomal protein S17 [Sulfuracidifex metallicus]|uniref:Small ribosomal subunit protein uS17 n=1 Tax=Sulfuracidifex metallicus DSM 6482 = JCM 9184 TaxID=523847 RepID=A0A6A9QMY3_SULME|nr:30S ribosomal protein S17 [Sulfuracidifex metallicus]MUN28551.1 30S ribosomal protein S17 [Sulfuracidifex metallicus DSM 6482 = JCM 9184]WOE50912.1 30S ribosomal protein S17 [Sulfuracidifex metallicus DSM 6482 = JCM 9184]
MKFSEVKEVGVQGVSVPSNKCQDNNCPYHGTLRVRGMIDEGLLVKYRARNMGVVEREYLYYNSKYKRYEKRRSKIHAHIPPCLDVKEGDRVIIGETRQLAKSISFVVLGKR